jgi:hypothetical protein
MATTISVTSFQTACAAVADAILAGDFATAWKQYAVAEAVHSGLEVQVGHENVMVMRRQKLDGLNAAIKAAESAAKRLSGSSGKRGIRLRTVYGRSR